MAPTLAQQLRERLDGRRTVLQRIGTLYNDSVFESTSRQMEVNGANDWWIHGEASRERTVAHLREEAEALALLNVLASIDRREWIQLIQQLWPRLHYSPCFVDCDNDNQPPCVVGFAYTVTSLGDLALFTELLTSETTASEQYVDDVAWLSGELGSLHHVSISQLLLLIPLQLVVSRVTSNTKLTSVLRSIHDHASTQQRSVDAATNDPCSQVTASPRFKVTRVNINMTPGAGPNSVSLESIALLSQQGIRVLHLPALRVRGLTPGKAVSVTKSLQTLMSSLMETTSVQSTEHVDVDEETTSDMIPASLSAVQTSRRVGTIEIFVENGESEYLERDATLWKWMAYSLFSRYADHDLRSIILHVRYLDDYAITAIEAILVANNPLAALFDTEFEEDQWLSATRFFVRDPRLDAQNRTHELLETSAPICVRIIDRSQHDGTVGWRVLLPGCGAAWVHDSDATKIENHSATQASQRGVLHIKFEDFRPDNQAQVVRLLELVACDRLHSLEMECLEDEFEDDIDVADWNVELIRQFPRVERLKYRGHLATNGLRTFVDAATAGQCRLRYLSLNETFYPDSTDFLWFLNVLSDMKNALTKTLEEISFIVCIPEDDTIREFNAAWMRLLQLNRTLHTISLTLIANEDIDDTEDHAVVIQSAPLAIERKLAFLSVMHDSSDSAAARTRLDPGVVSTIFAFAAHYRVRSVHRADAMCRNCEHAVEHAVGADPSSRKVCWTTSGTIKQLIPSLPAQHHHSR